MKKYILLSALACLLSLKGVYAQAFVNEQGLEWQTDLLKAHELSQKSGKPIFAFFTGSDWCGWCIKLQKNVFEKPGFVAWAKKNVILLELDYPRRKQQPQELMQQNAGLQQTFGVQGYPTVWIFTMEKDAATNKYNILPRGTLGYPQSAPGAEESEFLNKANSILSNKPLK
ncbi:MAG: thioredoxin family protein [Bacteroidia bacterium]